MTYTQKEYEKQELSEETKGADLIKHGIMMLHIT